MYKLITDEYFDPAELIASVDLSNEYSIVDLKNRIEASVVIWQKKMTQKDSGKLWGGHGVSHEKRGRFEGRAENVLLLLKHRFPGISQSALDISKIQYNRVLLATICNFHCVAGIATVHVTHVHCIHFYLYVCFYFCRMLAVPFWRATPGHSRAWPSRSCLASKTFSTPTPSHKTPRTRTR